MALLCTCGTELPDNARFCHCCGKPQREEDVASVASMAPLDLPPPGAPPIGFGNSAAMRVALLCAALSALLNSIPIVNLGCCVWFLGAGFLSAFLYGRRSGVALSVGAGARLGWITGLLTFLIGIVFTGAGLLLSRPEGGFPGQFRQALERLPAQDEATRRMVELLQTPVGLTFMLVTVAVTFFVLTVSLTIAGGALGAKVMEKE